MIKIYNSSLEKVGYIEDYTSFQYSEKYSDAGSFTIKLAYNKKYDDLLKVKWFIKYKDFDGFITSIQKTTDEDGVTEMIVAGSSLNWLLSMRINIGIPLYGKTVKGILTSLLDTNFVDGGDLNGSRKLPYFQIGTFSNLPTTTISSYKSENEDILNIISSLANDYNFGFKITLDEKNKKIIFNAFCNTKETTKIGTHTDNIIQRDYTYSIANLKNVGYVDAIDDIKSSHILTGVNLTKTSGFDRFETIASSEVTRQNDETETVFNQRINNTAAGMITKEVNVYDTELDTYLTDELELGEKIIIDDKEYNLNITLQVSEKQVTVETGIEKVNYIFGNDVKIQKRG